MRDPDLVVRAQLAASALESAWQRWRGVYGHTADSMPAVSSYVGYSLQEPWGVPRVVFGIAAEDAERLAALIDRHDSAGPAYAGVATRPGARDLPARAGAPPPVPRQAPSVAASMHVSHPLTDLLLAGDSSGIDEPVYRQAAAAMKQAAAARENASRASASLTSAVGTELASAPFSHEGSDSMSAALSEHSDRSSLADLVSPEWMGSLAMAAFTARTEAEARIKAALNTPSDEPADTSEPDTDAGQSLVAAGGRTSDDNGKAQRQGAGAPDDDVVRADDAGSAGLEEAQAVGSGDGRTARGENGRAASPRIYATDVLEPLPPLEVATGAGVADAGEPAGELGQDDKDQGAGGRDARRQGARGRDARERDARERDARERDVDNRDSRNGAGYEQDSSDRAAHERDAHDRAARDEDARERAADDEDARDTDAHDQVVDEVVINPVVDDRDVDDPDVDDRDVYAQDVDDDALELDDHEVAASAQPGGQGPGTAKRSRATRSYPIARLSKTKRPGAPSQPAGS